MNRIDKLKLLAELVGYKLAEEDIIEKQKEFSSLKENVVLATSLQEKSFNASPRYRIVKEKYDELNKTKIDSMEQYFVCLGNMYHLYYQYTHKQYANPLLCLERGQDLPLALLNVEFDGQERTIGDVVMLDNYTPEFKIEAVKLAIINWKKEVDDSLIRPLELLLAYPKNLPKRRKMSFPRKFLLGVLVLFTLGLTIALFSNDTLVRDLLINHNYPYLYYPIVALYVLVLFFDFIFTLTLLYNVRKLKKYLEAQAILFENPSQIMNKLNANTEALYAYLLNCIIEKKEITGLANKYSAFDKELSSLSYMKKMNENNSTKDDLIKNYEVVLLEIVIFLIIYVITVFVLIKTGVIA